MNILDLLLLVFNQYVLTVPGVLVIVLVLFRYSQALHAYGKEVLDVVFAFADALKPEPDGSVRIERAELERIKKEIGDLKNLGAFARFFGRLFPRVFGKTKS